MSVLELVGCALTSLRARPGRAALMALGPLLGVAAVVGALGVSTSARAELSAVLEALGTDLVLVHPSGSEGRLPPEAARRAGRVPAVAAVAELAELPAVRVRRAEGVVDTLVTGALRVAATSPSLAGVARTDVAWGRFVDAGDEAAGRRVAVLGARAARALGVLDGEARTVLLDDERFGVIGVLRPAPLMPDLDASVLIPGGAATRFGRALPPTLVAVRVTGAEAVDVARQLDVAITLGAGAPVQVDVPTELLSARAEVDRTFQVVVLAMGALALLVGGLGIANVMTISVLQRSAEIGVRRALGHARGLVAGQFLVEAGAVGLLGGLSGAAIGVAFVALAAARNGWVLRVDPAVVAAAVALAWAVAVVAGSYPAGRAARVDPSTALRST